MGKPALLVEELSVRVPLLAVYLFTDVSPAAGPTAPTHRALPWVIFGTYQPALELVM